MNRALHIENLVKYFYEPEPFKVLKGLSFTITKGEFVSIVGKSGCGKSTLLYVLSTMDTDYEGQLEINGEVLTGKTKDELSDFRNEHIGFVFQFHFLMLEFSALENVMMPMRKLGRLTPAKMAERAQFLLESVGLGQKTHRLGTQLSGGEQQRVAIARALANEPAIILADEPTGNLDVKNSAVVFDLLTRLAKENGQAIVLVTHNPEIANRCDHILSMRDGQFVA